MDDQRRFRIRRRIVAAAAAAVCAQLAPAVAQIGMSLTDPSGLSMGGGWMPIGSNAAELFISTQYTMGDLDPLSGSLLTSDVSHGGVSAQQATTHMLDTQQMLAFDAQRVAQQALEARERKKKQARAAGIAVGRGDNPGDPEDWELGNLSDCGADSNASHRARHEVVAMWEQMCAAAEADGVTLTVESSYRSPKRQGELYRQALAKYGSAENARKWVAYSDGVSCGSRHCAGIAFDVRAVTDPAARKWMHQTVGCRTGDQVTTGVTSCGAGQLPVARVNTFGFVFPLSNEPWHLEAGLRLDSTHVPANCSPADALTVPEQVASIFRCRLAEAGIDEQQAATVVAEALTVAECESGFQAEAVAFGGRYAERPAPDGNRYTAKGVFQFIRSTADRWIVGGYAQAGDPVKNIDAAARLWLSQGWKPWECAATGPHRDASVLPGWPGGPSQLPAWSLRY